MRVGSFNVQRPAYWDRNPVPIAKYNFVTITGPAAALVTAAMYTVPTGKRFIMSGIYLTHNIRVALTAGDFMSNRLIMNIQGGANTRIQTYDDYTTTANYWHEVVVPSGMTFYQTDVLSHQYQYNFAGAGSVSFWCAINGVEFDA